jgi:hypothetical protein
MCKYFLYHCNMVESCTVWEEPAVSAITLKEEAADYFETVELFNLLHRVPLTHTTGWYAAITLTTS